MLWYLRHLGGDFELETAPEIGQGHDGPAYRLGPFRAFLGQRNHARHQRFAASRATISRRPAPSRPCCSGRDSYGVR